MSAFDESNRAAARLAAHIGIEIADARHARRWTLRELARRSGLAVSSLHAIEHGRPASLESYASDARALGLELRVDLLDLRKRATAVRAEDPVHAAMGEMIAARMAGHGFTVAIDEPYQHYQFAGRADVLAWDLDRRALLHVENRTRFPDVQDAIGSYNAKRRYLPAVIAERLGLRSGFASVTNVMASLWSSEVLHSVRIRSATFRAVCPDDASSFEAWWTGSPVPSGQQTSAIIVIDPISIDASGRRAFAGLESALRLTTRPRYRGYADALVRLGR